VSIHPSRKRSMALSYMGFGAWVAALLAVFALGLVSLKFEAWRAVYLLAPLAVLVAIWRVARGR
jgi:hypothetical protein